MSSQLIKILFCLITLIPTFSINIWQALHFLPTFTKPTLSPLTMYPTARHHWTMNGMMHWAGTGVEYYPLLLQNTALHSFLFLLPRTQRKTRNFLSDNIPLRIVTNLFATCWKKTEILLRPTVLVLRWKLVSTALTPYMLWVHYVDGEVCWYWEREETLAGI